MMQTNYKNNMTNFNCYENIAQLNKKNNNFSWNLVFAYINTIYKMANSGSVLVQRLA